MYDDYEIEELKRKCRSLEEENEAKTNEIRRLHQVCREQSARIAELEKACGHTAGSEEENV